MTRRLHELDGHATPVHSSTRNQVTMEIKEYRPNAAIDAAKFAKPTTTRLIK